MSSRNLHHRPRVQDSVKQEGRGGENEGIAVRAFAGLESDFVKRQIGIPAVDCGGVLREHKEGVDGLYLVSRISGQKRIFPHNLLVIKGTNDNEQIPLELAGENLQEEPAFGILNVRFELNKVT